MNNQYGYGWNLLQTPLTFKILSDTTSLSLSKLPSQCRKIKLYIQLQSGDSPGDYNVNWTLSTKVDIVKVAMHPYHQQAYAVVCDNSALRLDERKIIELSRQGSFPTGFFEMIVQVLAYK